MAESPEERAARLAATKKAADAVQETAQGEVLRQAVEANAAGDDTGNREDSTSNED